MTTSCSWCHADCPAGVASCPACGHDVGVARLDCQYSRCQPAVPALPHSRGKRGLQLALATILQQTRDGRRHGVAFEPLRDSVGQIAADALGHPTDEELRIVVAYH